MRARTRARASVVAPRQREEECGGRRHASVFFSRTLASFPANQCVEFAGRNATSGFEDSSHSSSARKMMAKCVGVELRSCRSLSFSLPVSSREPSVCAQRRCALRALLPRAGIPLVWPKEAAKRRPTAARRRRRPWAAPPRARRRRRTSRMRSRCSSCCLHCTGSSGKVPSDGYYLWCIRRQ